MYPAILLYITHLQPLPMLCINVKLKDPIVCATTASASTGRYTARDTDTGAVEADTVSYYK